MKEFPETIEEWDNYLESFFLKNPEAVGELTEAFQKIVKDSRKRERILQVNPGLLDLPMTK